MEPRGYCLNIIRKTPAEKEVKDVREDSIIIVKAHMAELPLYRRRSLTFT